MSAAMLWPYGKCVECANKSDCADSQAQIIACMSNGYPDYKPQINADRIRAMSDEELAEWIDEFWSAAWCPDEPPVDPETKQCLLHDGDCRLCILDWLRQEVSD